MHLGFETLENRLNFAQPLAFGFAFNASRPSRGVAMPLRHETISRRRQPPADQEKWIVAEFRVESAPVRLWASGDAASGLV